MLPELLDILQACPETETWVTPGRHAEPDLAGARDKALLLVGFVGALRRSERVTLDFEDVNDHRQGLVVTVPRSKTNQEGTEPELVVLPIGPGPLSGADPRGHGKTTPRPSSHCDRGQQATTKEPVCDPRYRRSRSLVGGRLRALGLGEAPGKGPLESLIARLSKRDLLVVLDNCEHLIEACGALAAALVRECAGVRLLATSREHLGVAGEAVVDVGGLELPKGAGYVDEERLSRSEAGRLFIERARMARADFVAHGDDALVVACICERLDGIPLALEMAAARVRLMSVQAIAEGLSDRFSLLTGKERARPPRHRTLLASFEWSCGLLREGERCLLHRLSAFASGFTLAAAEAVCAEDEVERHDVFDLLSSLVDKSVVQALPEARGPCPPTLGRVATPGTSVAQLAPRTPSTPAPRLPHLPHGQYRRQQRSQREP